MSIYLDPSSRNETQTVPMEASRIAPLGIAAPADTIESMAAPTESPSNCLTNLLHCLASPFIALWNWLFGCCCSRDTSALTAPLEQLNPLRPPLEQLNLLNRRFNNLYNFLLSQVVRPEWKEAVVVSKNGQALFSQLDKRSRNTVDNFKNQTIQNVRSALEGQTPDSTYEITMMFVEKGSNNELYSAHWLKDVSVESIDIDRYTMKDATQARVQDLIKLFNQDQIEPLTEFFFQR